MYIAFFDSGLGGLNPLKRALADLPDENYIYYGDTANVPYGTKSPREIQDYMLRAMDYLAPYDLKALVIACNTATSVAAPFLRQRFSLPIIGMEPAIKPAAAAAAKAGKRVLLLATILTLKIERIADLRAKVDPDSLVDAVACSELVDCAERLIFDRKTIEDLLRRKLASYDLSQYGWVVLGCTHFNYFQEAIEAVFPPGTSIVDGNEGTIRRLAEIIHYQPQPPAGKGREILLHLSDSSDQAKALAAADLIRQVTPVPVRLV